MTGQDYVLLIAGMGAVTYLPRMLPLGKLELFVAVPTLLVAVKTRSLAGTVLAGMLLYWLGGKAW